MNYKKDNYKFLYIFVVVILFSFMIAFVYIQKKEKSLLQEAYKLLLVDITNSLNTQINNKNSSTIAISIPLSKDEKIKKSFSNKNFSNLNYDLLSYELKKYTNYQNVWIQLIDKNGYSIYRSWSEDKTKKIQIFTKEQLVNKKDLITKTIDVDSYDLSFNSTVPIFNENEFLGWLQVKTKFNSIATSLKELGFESVILVNKKYKNILVNSFSNTFIEDYYVSNINFDKNLLNKLEKIGIDNILKINDFLIIDDYYVANISIENNLANIILLRKIEEINIESIKDFKLQSLTLLFFIFFLIIFIMVVFYFKNYSKNIRKLNTNLIKSIRKIKEEKNKAQLILDSQLNIIVITDGEEILNANEQLLKFFPQCKSIKEFKDKYTCVCTFFIPIENDESYVIEKDYNGLNWAEYILSNSDKSFKAAMYDKNEELKHFKLTVSQTNVDDFIIVTLTDITYEIKLQADSKQKDKLIFQQNKMASIAQMLHNIAHQWRQPLSVISTTASSINLYKDLGSLNDELIEKNCNLIVDKSKYLSDTIEDFRNFFVIDEKLEKRELNKIVNDCIKYLETILHENKIDVILNLEENIYVEIYENEFKQSLLKIIENSIEFLSKNTQENDRVIILKLTKESLIINDSAKGVIEDDLHKIFEPYYTTKHKSQGVGLGLYMVQETLCNQMGFKLDVFNIKFEYKNKIQEGLSFIIIFKQEN